MKRFLWVLVPLALMVLVVFAARYLIEYTDGVQHEKVVVIPRKM